MEENISIFIENHTTLFENEEEIIKQGAKELLKNGNVKDIEEGIIVFATMFRGLKFQKIEKDESNNITIILRDLTIDTQKRKRVY